MGATVLLGFVVPAVPVWMGIATVGAVRWISRFRTTEDR